MNSKDKAMVSSMIRQRDSFAKRLAEIRSKIPKAQSELNRLKADEAAYSEDIAIIMADIRRYSP